MIGEAKLRSPEVFAVFYDETLPRIYGYFLRRCGGSVSVAEDLTSETYLRAVAQLKRSASVDDPVRWLFGIARYTLIDHYRSSLRTGERDLAWDDRIEAVADDHDPYTAVLDRDQAIAALNRLSPDQRLVIALRYLDELRVTEIATATGKSEHAIESLLARGRTNFKRHYREHHDE
ncbi:MAG: RNA polymerase sigma factor [Thermomicrobiales bacterium]|nr:RNA polymerase sigma factor [Thermomicrobiales bacterium]